MKRPSGFVVIDLAASTYSPRARPDHWGRLLGQWVATSCEPGVLVGLAGAAQVGARV
jgi:hypothetical protein